MASTPKCTLRIRLGSMALAVELIAVGTELLLGQLIDTNTVFVAQRSPMPASTCTGRTRSATTVGASRAPCVRRSNASTASLRPADSGRRSTT